MQIHAERVEPGVTVTEVPLRCSHLTCRLEPGYVVKLRIGGSLQEDVYSIGAATGKRLQLLETFPCAAEREMSDGDEATYSDVEEETPSPPQEVEVVPWDEDDRLLLASSSSKDMHVLR